MSLLWIGTLSQALRATLVDLMRRWELLGAAHDRSGQVEASRSAVISWAADDTTAETLAGATGQRITLECQG